MPRHITDLVELPFEPSPTEAIVATQTSACVGCALAQACPVFALAARDQLADYGYPCPETKPGDESVSPQYLSKSPFTGADLIYDPPLHRGGRQPVRWARSSVGDHDLSSW
jgi:hypothetical protein